MNLVGFCPNYPSLEMSKALGSIVDGRHAWNAEEVESIIDQAMVLINERRRSFTRLESTKLNALLGLAKEAA